ncbi:MAG: hypothetical protein BJ554DRAFT_7292 [Olpidium bornovanus]|uniref:Uncharacterized protein n=1 Tax=Olpidium bornovanus TaxID=278681 RepID=A0A8H7ZWP1_9FUNG|nr:MAG: hypothetical protein BJ554DRAFT_7292 [Olpidium bornovanus]
MVRTVVNTPRQTARRTPAKTTPGRAAKKTPKSVPGSAKRRGNGPPAFPSPVPEIEESAPAARFPPSPAARCRRPGPPTDYDLVCLRPRCLESKGLQALAGRDDDCENAARY